MTSDDIILERTKQKAATLAYAGWVYRETHAPRSPLDEMYRGQMNAAMDLLRCLCDNDHAAVVRACALPEAIFQAAFGDTRRGGRG